MAFGEPQYRDYDGLKLPEWVDEGRLGGQLEAAEAIMEHYRAGRRVVLLDSPPGQGKTLIAEIVRQRLAQTAATLGWRTRQRGRFKSIYTCTDRELQRQMARDFVHADLLMGRANYRTETSGVTTDSCNQGRDRSCTWCPDRGWWNCAYQRAKRQAAYGDLMVTNLAYLLAEANSGRRSITGNRDFVILDEVDLVEGWLRNTVEIKVSAWMRRRLGIGVPKHKTVASSWQSWIDLELAPAVAGRIAALEGSEDPKEIAEYKGLLQLERNLVEAQVGANWVYDGYQGSEDGRHPVIFRPVHVDSYGQDLLWGHAPRWLAMSGTIISPEQMAVDLGLEDEEWACVQMDSPFDPARSPVQVRPVANMSYKVNEWELLAAELERVIEAHPGQRILVHTVSYRLTQQLRGYLTSPRVLAYDNSKAKERTLREYKSRTDAVMLAPSMDRGISLDDDLARVVIVAKVPYASLGDKQVAARLYSRGGDTWYQVEAVRTLVQSLYRGTRSASDWSLGMILDSQFISNIWKRNRTLLPGWFRKRLDMTGRALPETGPA